MGTQKSILTFLSAKDHCPHCESIIMLNVIRPKNPTDHSKYIDKKGSLLYQKMKENISEVGAKNINFPSHESCPSCQKIIFFLDEPDVTILKLDIKASTIENEPIEHRLCPKCGLTGIFDWDSDGTFKAGYDKFLFTCPCGYQREVKIDDHFIQTIN